MQKHGYSRYSVVFHLKMLGLIDGVAMKIKVLVVDDHPLFLDAILYTLKRLSDEVDVLDANHIDQALRLAESNSDLDLMLIDLCMPSSHGVTTIAHFAERFPSLPIVVISAFDENKVIEQVLAIGAMGFISKTANSEEIIAALQQVLQGHVYLPVTTLDRKSFRTDFATAQLLADKRVTRNIHHGLTPRQIEVIKYLAKGQTNKEIALAMDISESTIKIHLSDIYYKLGVNSRSQAILVATQLGILKSKTKITR